MSGFAARGNAVEGSYFRKEQEFALRKQLERLVGEGQLPKSALQQPQSALQLVADAANRGSMASTSHMSLADVPVSVLKGRPAGEYVYQHVKGVVPGRPHPLFVVDLSLLLHGWLTLCWDLQCQSLQCPGLLWEPQ